MNEDPMFWGSQNLADPQSLNAYSYANNNPITLSDPSGLMTLAEIQTKINSIRSQVATITKAVGNYTAQAGKAAVNGVKSAATTAYNAGASAVAKVNDYVSNPDPDKNIFRERTSANGTAGLSDFDAFLTFGVPVAGGMAVEAEKGGQTAFKTFRAFKKALGAAGENNEWHHIVEQGGKNATQFAAEQLHNLQNVVNVPAKVNQAINGIYGRISDVPGFNRFRDYVQSLPFDEQYKIGLDILSRFIK